ncbi:MAG TPA: hypothetical protein VGG64_04790 [Pirellulales bacterium]|jgi:uncharacterized repeat protein (TIGR01451 family)
MKRMMIRLSALTAVLSLGTFAVVQAQRSTRPTEAEVASDEPARLNVDERAVKPMPQPTELYTQSDRYAPLDTQTAAPATDPFAAQAAAGRDMPLADAGNSMVPPSDSQTIPTAAEAMRRYGASRQQAEGRANIRSLGYDEAPTAGQSPDDAGDASADEGAPFPPAADRNEPTLAAPRSRGDQMATQTDITEADANLPAEPPTGALMPETTDNQIQDDAPRNSLRGEPLAEDRYRQSATPVKSREPALLPDEPLDDRQSLAPTNNFAPPVDNNFAPRDSDAFASPRQTQTDAPSEGAGRPGGKHLEGQQTPHLTVEKIAPPEIQVGKPAVFVLKVRNTGQVAAAHVEVHDQVPKGTQLMSTTPRAAEPNSGEVVWSLGALKPGEEISVELELMPVAEGEVGSVATVHFAAESSVRTMVTKPVLMLDVKAAHEVLLGEDLKMAIKLTNTGTGAATGVLIREAVPDLLQHPAGTEVEYDIGTLKPGESRELDLVMHAVKAGRVQNMLSAIGEGSLRVDQQADLEVIAPALALKMEGPGRRYLDRQATYTVSVSNPGTAPAKEISLITHLPAGLKFVEANNAGQYDPRTRAVQWLLDELPANETGSVTLTTVPIEIGEQLVRIESTAERGLSAQEEKKILVEGVAAINFEVVDVADPIEVGGETAYEVRVVNQGTKTATNVQVVALLPEELKPIGGEGPARYTIDGQRVLFEPLAQLAPKADTTYRVKAQGRGPGDVRVRVQIITEEIRKPVTKEESTRVYADE